MTSRESQGQIEAIHGIEASPSPISAIADAGMDAVTAWRNRPLEPCYPGRYSQVSNTAGFGASAILPDGAGDVLGLRFRANEGATVRAKDLNALRNRRIQDIPIAVEDRDLAAKYPAPSPNWRRAWTGGIPFLDDPPEGRKRIYTAPAIEARTSKLRRAVRAW